MDHRQKWFRGNGRQERVFREGDVEVQDYKTNRMSNRKPTAVHGRCKSEDR